MSTLGSIGREAAPKLLGGLSGSMIAGWLGLTSHWGLAWAGWTPVYRPGFWYGFHGRGWFGPGGYRPPRPPHWHPPGRPAPGSGGTRPLARPGRSGNSLYHRPGYPGVRPRPAVRPAPRPAPRPNGAPRPRPQVRPGRPGGVGPGREGRGGVGRGRGPGRPAPGTSPSRPPTAPTKPGAPGPGGVRPGRNGVGPPPGRPQAPRGPAGGPGRSGGGKPREDKPAGGNSGGRPQSVPPPTRPTSPSRF